MLSFSNFKKFIQHLLYNKKPFAPRNFKYIFKMFSIWLFIPNLKHKRHNDALQKQILFKTLTQFSSIVQDLVRFFCISSSVKILKIFEFYKYNKNIIVKKNLLQRTFSQ